MLLFFIAFLLLCLFFCFKNIVGKLITLVLKYIKKKQKKKELYLMIMQKITFENLLNN